MNRVILPLDGMDVTTCLVIVEGTKDLVWGYKLNDLLHEQDDARAPMLKYLRYQYGSKIKIMADPKLYDIPNTMYNYMDKLTCYADIVTVHCTAEWIPEKIDAEKIAGVTVLTSTENSNFYKNESNKALISEMASFAAHAGYGYVVCSGKELGYLSNVEIPKICPGIRPEWSLVKDDDQKRIVTPGEAINMGAELLVIGRPIYRVEGTNIMRSIRGMREALEKTNKEIKENS